MTITKSLAKRRWATFALIFAIICVPGALAVLTELPGKYLVEFTNGYGDAPDFYSNLTGCDIPVTPRVGLDHQLFRGASFELANTHDNKITIDTIQSMAMVNRIWQMKLYSRPATFLGTPDSITVQSMSKKRRAIVDDYAPHVMSGVNKLHAEGYTGQGIFIGVIDSGVDYTHPALGGGFGRGKKIVAGTDLVGNDYDGKNQPYPDRDPMDCEGHGTHVSGIIGANPNPFNFTGVAPDATMGMWKVFGCDGQVSEDILIQAFNLAYEAGVDLISSSISAPSGWTEGPLNLAVQRITEKGVPCIVAAGNDGQDGVFFASSAADSIGATGVGSVESITQPSFLTVASYLYNVNMSVKFTYAQGKLGDFGTISVPLWALTLNNTVQADGCLPFPVDTPDLSSFVVLLRRGDCTFDTKIANGVAHGAQRFLFYNNLATVPTPPGDTSISIPVGMVSDVQGAEWISQLKAGVNITVEFTALDQAQQIFTNDHNTVTGGKMSAFSSWGPTLEGWIKPEVSAPGGIILSTFPVILGSYAVFSGTSMATPYISGVIALLKQIQGKKALTPDAMTSLLATTAEPVQFNDGRVTYDFLAPVVQQGGGLVDAHRASHTTTFLDLDNIALNDTSNFKAAHTVTISNKGKSNQTYAFENILAPTVFTLSTGEIVPDIFPPNLSPVGATIHFEPKSLTIAANSSGQVVLHFTSPTGLNPENIPVYSGFVGIKSTGGENLTLPYAGIASRLKDAKIMDTAAGFPFLATNGASTEPAANGSVFVLPVNGSTRSNSDVFPGVAFRLAMGSRVVRIDIVPENPYGLPRVIGQQILGSLPKTPLLNHPRLLQHFVAWDGQLDDGRRAPAGRYRFLLRALRIMGNQTYDHDYELYKTILFEIKYKK